MQTDELISVGEYLNTSYRPDCDYVDGMVLQRNLGERDHAKLQGAVFAFYCNRRKRWGIHVYPEQRVRVSATRFRIPDVSVVVGEEPPEPVFTGPPFICLDILSREDRLSEIERRVGGVPYVRILDPTTRKAWRCSTTGLAEVGELRTEGPEMVVPLDALFE